MISNMDYILGYLAITLVPFIGFIACAYYIGSKIYSSILRKRFFREYSVVVPDSMSITTSKSPKYNYYTLAFPHWSVSKKDGTADLRVKNNHIVWRYSCLYLKNFCITSKEPYIMVCFVHKLRKSNIDIAKNELEINKYRAISNLRHLNSNIYSIGSIVSHFSSHPTDFEGYCANLFSRMGYNATVTPPTNDGGYDIFLERSGETAVVECKCYSSSNSIGRPALQKLYGANCIAKAKRLIFITTSQFSKNAVEYAEKTGIELIDGQQLISLLTQYKIINHSEVNIDSHDCELTLSDLKPYIPSDIFKVYEN